MKYPLLLAAAVSLVGYSCTDDEGPAGPSNEEILTQRIEDIIPQEYLDTLEQLGLEIHFGTNPPNVEGSYDFKPSILDTSNIATDMLGQRFLDAVVHLSEQRNEDFSIKLIGEHFLGNADTSIATAISGSGNDFTVYGKVKSEINPYSAIFAILLSATKEGDDLKNAKVALMNIDNSEGGTGVFIEEGQARIIYDSDLISEKISSVQATLQKHSVTGGSSGAALPGAAPGNEHP